MKKSLLLFATAFVALSTVLAAQPVKSQAELSVRKQVMDSKSNLLGRIGSSRQKTLTLKVQITNTSSKTIAEGSLSGSALILRAGELHERLVKEPLAAVTVPAMKPNERITLELGEIRVQEIEVRNRKVEDTLEEWKVVYSSAGSTTGTAVSSGYDAREKEVSTPAAANLIPARRIGPAVAPKRMHRFGR